MPDVKYTQDTRRFEAGGLELNRPVDSCKPGKWPYLQNVRQISAGQMDFRPGLVRIGTPVVGQTPVHSARRLNDPLMATFTRVIGAGTHLAIGQSLFTDIDSGYSGDPLALIPYRPDQSPESWMYMADRSRMRKVNIGGSLHQIGLPTPATVPVATLGTVFYSFVTLADATAGWANAGTAGAISLITRVSTTINRILYDSGANGFALIEPVDGGAGANMASIGPGMILQFRPATTNESVAVQATFPISTQTTIARIIYDSGTDGACSISMTTPLKEIIPDSMVLLNGVEAVRVVSVTNGPQTGQSFRCVTAGTFVAGDTVKALAAFRAATVATFVAADTISTSALRSSITVGTGTLSLTTALDLSILTTGVPIQPDDYMHISVRVDVPTQVTTLNLYIDVDETTNDFTRNYYKKTFTGAADLTPKGTNQWVELKFKISSLTRFGTDLTRTLKNVAAIRLEAVVTGTTQLDFDSWQISGGFGPDVLAATGVPYLYRYRARVSSTGARSNPSPAMRSGVIPFRQQNAVFAAQYTLATEADVLDFERFGGEIAAWHYVGSRPNTTNPVEFDDIYTDLVVAGNPLSVVDSFQPWPVIDIPRSGTTGPVAGTTVDDSGTSFNTAWAQGTEITINGIPYTIYRVVSTSRLEIVENAGSQNAVSWKVAEPLLVSQPLPCLWGPVNETLFACGDLHNPQRLYFTVPGSESTLESGSLDITSPSEPLQNGVVYNARCYVWSTERMFQILPTGDVNIPWRYEEITSGKGLFSRWYLTRIPGPWMAWGSKDGIEISAGGAPQSLTDEDMYPLFPNEGNLGKEVNTIKAPLVTGAEITNLRLDFYDDYLYFNYRDTDTNRRTLIYSAARKGWFFDIYNPGTVFHYGEEGDGVHLILCGGSNPVNGILYSLNGTGNDDGTTIAWKLQTPSVDQNVPRNNKRYGDVMVDLNPNGTTVSILPGVTNNTNLLVVTFTSAAVRTQMVASVGSAWVTAKNICLNLLGSITSSLRPVLFIWEPRWTFEPAVLSAFNWEVAPTSHGMPNFKSLGAGRVGHVSTADLSLIVTVDGVVQTPIVIPNSGGIYKTTWFRFPVYKGKLLQYRISSEAEWRLDGRDSFIQIKEWANPGSYQELGIFSDYSFIQG